MKNATHFQLNLGHAPGVLLVDDEKEFVEALAERLKMRDLESDTVYDGDHRPSLFRGQGTGCECCWTLKCTV